MSLSYRNVEAAVDRWESKGMLDAATAARLREEAHRHEGEGTRRRARYLVAAVGAFALFVAAVVFAERTWPLLDDAGRTVVLLVTGGLVYALGTGLELRRRWLPTALLLQTGGLGVLLAGEIYSVRPWADASAGGITIGVLALVVPLVVLVRFRGREPLTHALHTAFVFPFVAVFLSRALDLGFDEIVWILDGIALLTLGGLALRLPALDTRRADQALASFSAALVSGLALSIVTGLGPLELEARAALAADAWLALIAAVTMWGLHRAPPALRRSWFEIQLSLVVLIAIPLLMFTTIEALDWAAEGTALVQGTLGAAGLWYGLRAEVRGVLMGGAVALAAGAWFYGVERGEALGAVGALVVTAGLLFWVSTRIREGTSEG